ncbi:ATP-binding protein [Streptomyces sp. NPDC093568]|uniref:ATP-binding protein n=1 Tax=Streptomyces sp. NPDC093568 TaxID=3366041 RepID=UPI00380A391A
MPSPVTAMAHAAIALGEPLAHAHIDLTGLARPQKVARDLVRETLDGVDTRSMDDVELVAAELVCNADSHVPGNGPMQLAVDCYARGVLLQVSDSGTDVDAIPREPKPPTPESQGGRGLVLMQELASSWDVVKVESGKKVVAVFLHQPTRGS